MELIKKIKQAETQAKEFIEQAKSQVTNQAEDGRRSRQEALEKAEHERKKAIEDAIAQAESQGSAEVEDLKAQAENQRRQLHKKVSGKVSATAQRRPSCSRHCRARAFARY